MLQQAEFGEPGIFHPEVMTPKSIPPERLEALTPSGFKRLTSKVMKGGKFILPLILLSLLGSQIGKKEEI
jgi:hypothetical protein